MGAFMKGLCKLADALAAASASLQANSGSAAAAAAAVAASGTAEAGAEPAADQHATLWSELAAAKERMDSETKELAALADSQQSRETMDRLAALVCHAAGALQRFWALPEQQAEASMQLARAAAARSCANLRCPNLGLGGSPGAGEGRGCMRCSGCRTVWFCSAGCSQAGWRSAGGGHRLVCEQLAAERAARAAQAEPTATA
ncbi:hypothetical protein ABPG75_003132 [Micractinium tetrahymenae]